MLGSLSKREFDDLINVKIPKNRREYERKNDEWMEDVQWDPEVDNLKNDRSKLLKLLGTVVP